MLAPAMATPTKTTTKAETVVRVHYLENPNAIRAEAEGRVIAQEGDRVDVEIKRRAGVLKLFGVPLRDPKSPSLPSWEQLEPAAPPKG